MTRNDFNKLIEFINDDMRSCKENIAKGGYTWTVQKTREYFNGNAAKLLRAVKSLHSSLSVSKPDHAETVSQMFDLEKLFSTPPIEVYKQLESGALNLSELTEQLISLASEEELDEAHKAFDEPQREGHTYTEQLQKLKIGSRNAHLPGISEIDAALDRANELLVKDLGSADAGTVAVAMDRAVNNQGKIDTVNFYKTHPEFQAVFDLETSGNAAHLSVSKLGETPELSKALADQELFVDPNHKQAILAVMQKMDDLDLIPDDKVEGEQGVKVYAFHKYSLARSNLVKAINEGDVRAIGQLNEEVAKWEERMDQLYEFAAGVLNTDPVYMPTNVDNLRNADIPPKYKKDHQLNAMLNSIFITKHFAKEYGISDLQMADNPIKSIKAAVTADRERFTPTNYMKSQGSMGKFLAEMTKKAPIDEFDKRLQYKWVRAADIFLPATDVDSLREFNNATYKHFQSFCTRLSINTTLLTSEYADQFLSNQSNIMYSIFTPKDQLDPLTLETGIVDPHTMKPISKPFKVTEHIGANEIDTAMLFNNIHELIGDYIAAEGSPEGLVRIVNNVRTAIGLVMMSNPIKNEPTNEEASLMYIHDNTLKYLDDVAFSKGVALPELNGVKTGKLKYIEESFSKLSPSDQKKLDKFYKSEKDFNKKLNGLTEKLAKLESGMIDPTIPIKKADKMRVESLKVQAQIDQLKLKQLDALMAARENGTVTDLYFNQRNRDIASGEHNRRPSMYVSGLYFVDGKADTGSAELNAKAEKLERDAKVAYLFRQEYKIPQAAAPTLESAVAPAITTERLDRSQLTLNRTSEPQKTADEVTAEAPVLNTAEPNVEQPEDDMKIIPVPGSDTIQTVQIPPIETGERVNIAVNLHKPTERTSMVKEESDDNRIELSEKDGIDVPN